jgi:hypothetical protein
MGKNLEIKMSGMNGTTGETVRDLHVGPPYTPSQLHGQAQLDPHPSKAISKLSLPRIVTNLSGGFSPLGASVCLNGLDFGRLVQLFGKDTLLLQYYECSP